MTQNPRVNGREPFGARLARVMDERGALCVGIDPHTYLLKQWGLPVSAVGAHEFGLRVVEAAAAGGAGIIKPQVAFYERFGANGFRVLEDVFAAAREHQLMVIADVKRGDVGTTLDAYSEAWLGEESPLSADAMTLNPYQGFDTLQYPLNIALEQGKGLFILAATSNPESASVQTARRVRGSQNGRTVAGGIAARAALWNREHFSDALGSVGIVMGATVDADYLDIDIPDLATKPGTPILAPGFGHQGASLTNIKDIFGNASSQVIVNSSRSLLEAGQTDLPNVIRAQVEALRKALQ